MSGWTRGVVGKKKEFRHYCPINEVYEFGNVRDLPFKDPLEWLVFIDVQYTHLMSAPAEEALVGSVKGGLICRFIIRICIKVGFGWFFCVTFIFYK